MTDSEHEMEIKSTSFEQDCSVITDTNTESIDNTHDVTSLHKIITKLKNDLNNLDSGCENDKIKEAGICCMKEQLLDMQEKYCDAVNNSHGLTKMKHGGSTNDEYPNTDCQNDILTDDMPVIVNDSNKELIDTKIVVNNGSDNEDVFIYDQKNGTKFNDGFKLPDYSGNNKQKLKDCCNSEEFSGSSINNRKKRNKGRDLDFEKDAIRDDLMALAGEMKLLNQQNCNLLRKIECSKKKTSVLSNSMQKKSGFNRYKPDDENCTEVVPKSNDMNSKVQDLICENSRLRDALKETERDRCQIELAKKILNVNDSQCANCAGKEDESKVKKLTEEFSKLLTHYRHKLFENETLQNRLNEEMQNNRTYENRLMISKTQVVQLEKQLFALNLAPSNDPEVVRQNDQYAIESLKHRLRETNKEHSDLQAMFDFHLTELEDKKSKYLAVLQTNEEQKHYIEVLCEQKCTIAKEYEVEFNRMNEHMQQRLQEIEALPALLATAKRDLENEKLANKALEEKVGNLEYEITELKNSIVCDDFDNGENIRKDLEEENLELKATVVTLTDNLDESQRRYVEHSHCLIQMQEHLNLVREEAAIQVTKVKDISDYQKCKYKMDIQNLEKNLATCRAVACAEFKKRDSVDERLRNQIETLTKSLNEAYEKINDFQATNKLIELNVGEEMCKVPLNNVTSQCRGGKKHGNLSSDS